MKFCFIFNNSKSHIFCFFVISVLQKKDKSGYFCRQIAFYGFF